MLACACACACAEACAPQGFSASLNAIIENLPAERQTLLFSATQTRKVSDLARLSLRDPEYVAVHENATSATPPRLTQLVATVALPDKLHAVWGFVKTHLTSKTLIFLSSCRQVAFIHEALRQLRPGVPLRALHGRMKQSRRMAAFYDFCSAPAMVMLATDIAARGLDFPDVDWVLQADAPEDVAAYIHRVGRTARYTSAGKSLLLLLPSEAALLPQLAAAKVALSPTLVNLSKTPLVTPALSGLLSQDPALKAQAQKAVVSYLKSVYLQPNKAVFDVAQLPVAAFAASLGLTNAPKLRFVTRDRGGNFAPRPQDAQPEDEDDDDDDDAEDDEDAPPRAARAALRPQAEAEEEDDGGSDSELMAVKRADHVLPGEPVPAPEADACFDGVAAPARAKKAPRLRIKSGGTAGGARGTKVVFDADGTPRMPLEALAMQQEAEAEPARCAFGLVCCLFSSTHRLLGIAVVRRMTTARPWRRGTPRSPRRARLLTWTTRCGSASCGARRSARARTSCARVPTAPPAAGASSSTPPAAAATAEAERTTKTEAQARTTTTSRPSSTSPARSAPSARLRTRAWRPASSAWRSWSSARSHGSQSASV